MAANGSTIIPGPRPGLLLDTATGEFMEAKIISQRVFYDTERLATPLPPGDEYFFFRNLNFPGGARKNLAYTNMVTQKQFPSGWAAQIMGISFRPLKLEEGGVFPTAEDMIRGIAEGAMTFTRADQRKEAEGKLSMFPSPFGMNVFANSVAPIPDISMVNNGSANASSVPGMKYPIGIANQETFEIKVEYPRGVTLDADIYLLCELHVILMQPML